MAIVGCGYDHETEYHGSLESTPTTMNALRCPHCWVRLKNYLYADACPHCQHELLNNTRVLISVPRVEGRRNNAWYCRMFRGVVRLIES